MARLLLDHHEDINGRDPITGETPLIRAARENQTEMVKLLLQAGADKSLKDKDGQTALDWARSAKSDTLVDLLTGVNI